MKISQFFTNTGLWGVAFFVFGNFCAGFGWWSLTAGSTSEWYIAMTGGGWIAALLSVPMMLIGRAYDVTIIHIPKDSIS